MASALRSLLTRAQERTSRTPAPGSAPAALPAARPPSAEAEARCEAALARLRAALAGDEAATAVLELVVMGIDQPAEQAGWMGVEVPAVYEARDRVARAVERAKAEDVKVDATGAREGEVAE